MLKKSAALRLWSLFLSCCCAFSTLSSAQTVANRQAVMSQARRAYYNLRSEGLSGFECSISPNWEALLKGQVNDDDQSPEAVEERQKNIQSTVETLSQIHFDVAVTSDGSVNLTHNDLSDQSEQMMAALKQIYGGMEQMTSGFFDTWKQFMLSAPFPEVSSDYQIQARGQQYLLIYRDGTSDVATTMGRDFAISNLKITAAEFDSSIQPSFTRTPKGYLLSGYTASYQSQKPEGSTELKARINYQTVDGFQMLRTLNLTGTYGGSPFAVELTFSGCQVTRKQ